MWPYQWPNRPCSRQFSDGEHTSKHTHLRCKHTYVHQKALEMPRQQIAYLPPANLGETKTSKQNVLGATVLALDYLENLISFSIPWHLHRLL